MKKLLLMFAAVGVLFTACNKETDCGHEFIEHDFTQDIVGTWTFVEDDLAEAMVIKADGSFTTTGVMKGGSLYEEKGTIKVVNNKVTLAFDGDKDTFEGRLEFVAGKSMSIVMFNDDAVRLTYDYCENDFSKEIVGMWVCMQEAFGQEEEMVIQIFDENGIGTFTGYVPDVNGYIKEAKFNYGVVGNLLITTLEDNNGSPVSSVAIKIDITPNAVEYGDIMSTYNPVLNTNSAFLRIKQYLELPGMKYDYIKTFVTNVKGEDKDIPFLNTSFNFAKMDGSIIDKFLKSILFTVEFPEANKIKYSYLLEGKNIVIDAPIEVDGNKMTIKMSAINPAYQDVDMYAFQDQDNTQMHWYMPTTSFEKFFGNTSVALMLGYGQLDKDDTEGIANVYKTIADAVESINLSIVMSQSK